MVAGLMRPAHKGRVRLASVDASRAMQPYGVAGDRGRECGRKIWAAKG